MYVSIVMNRNKKSTVNSSHKWKNIILGEVDKNIIYIIVGQVLNVKYAENND